ATDLHTPTLTQMAVYEAVKDGFLAEHLPNVREIYRRQGRCMLEAIEREFPAGVTWTKPEGGMFLWVTVPAHIDTQKLLAEAVEQNVAFVPGGPFFAGKPQHNTLRLSFATVPEEKIRAGIAILGKLLKQKV
ncbi:MAG TPA: aminotransferase class I/II-fold pyridoxal phosphate-dependent enzyme, partial [Bordetella sp.]|uniref:aminotransferase class I/II-fold pyridoxal phosphate-dependent enzyme n=1 Tax=Bordetella sp. TaxID=28081 RepID=UPI002ED0E3C3